MIAAREAWQAGLFRRKHWLPNLVAGVVVGVVALPLAMAFAIASGLKPEQGLYTAIVAGVVVALAGGSRVQIAGPTGAFVVILAAITAEHGVDGLLLATMMAGVMLMLLGVLRLGSIIKFVPAPVIVGFTAGIGVLIFAGQWRYFFGLPEVDGAHFHEQVVELFWALPHTHPATLAFASLSLLTVLFWAPAANRLWIPAASRIPGPLVAMVLATLVQAMFHVEGVETIGSLFGGIPQGLPSIAVPEVTFARVLQLMAPAFTIMMLGAIESLLSAVVADGMTGTRHDSNQELIGQGLANVLTPLVGGFAATGAIARTATNVRNGGNSPLAGIVHSVLLLLVLLFLAPLAAHIPLAALAAILFVVAYNMSDVRHFVRMLRHAPRADVAILLITFTLTVFVDLVIAVNIGVILATLVFLRRMAASVAVAPAAGEELGEALADAGLSNLPESVLVYSIDGPMFFGAVETFERALARTGTDPAVLIIRLRWVPFIDMTGLEALDEAITNLRKRGIVTLMTGANRTVLRALIRGGIIRALGRDQYFGRLDAALKDAAKRVAVRA
jgi:sulfate permease, SulP family